MDKRHNAIRHGLLRKKTLLMPGESRYLFRKLNNRLADYWQPLNLAEKIQVEELAFNYWRLKRAYQLETEFIQESKTKAFKYASFTVEFLNFKNFDRFTRYITSIQRQISRNLHELERLQAARNGQNVPPPAVLDVDINLGQSQSVWKK